MIFEVILLSAHFLTISSTPVVPAQDGCAEGEPAVGRFAVKNNTKTPETKINLSIVLVLVIYLGFVHVFEVA